jgi:DNA-binding HxlR family transcriptional regulator
MPNTVETLLIIRDLIFKGKVHYGDFLGSEEEIATNILAGRLKMLEQVGILEKSQDPHTKQSISIHLLKKA